MKTFLRITFLAGVVLTLLAGGVAYAQDSQPPDKVILGGHYALGAGEAVGNLTVLGGDAVLARGSTVAGSIVLIGGNLTIEGVVGSVIHIYGGNLSLNDTAVVNGDILLAGGNLDRSSGAKVNGSVTHNAFGPFNFEFQDTPVLTLPHWWRINNSLLSQSLWFLGQSFGLTVLAMLLSLFAPKVMERAGDAAAVRPWEAGGLGLLIAILTPVALIGFAITIIGIPITFLLAVIVGVILTFGWLAVGMEVGKRLGLTFHGEWPAVLTAGLGTLLLSLAANGIGLVPCVGWIVPTVIGFVGMGGVLLSRFGTRDYPGPASFRPAPLA